MLHFSDPNDTWLSRIVKGLIIKTIIAIIFSLMNK